MDVTGRVAKAYYDFTVRQGWGLAGHEEAILEASRLFSVGLLEGIDRNGISLGELLGLRPAVMAFALAMEATLKQHDGKGGWSADDCSISYLQNKLAEEVAELFRGICANEEPDGEAVDLANLAMMLWTRYRYMGEQYQE